MTCRYCHGKGFQYVESGSSLSYECPDCGGTGEVEICEVCGHSYPGEYCPECFSECENCGEVVNNLDLIDGLCPDCEWERQQQKGA
jgi:RecJ-like exonuclease